MNCQSAKHSGDAYPLPSFLIFNPRPELGVQSSRDATVFTNRFGSHTPSIWDMPSTRWCQLSFQMVVRHPQATTDTAAGSNWEELRAMSHPEKNAGKSHLLLFSRTRGVLFLLAGSFTIGMKLIYCYTGLKYLRFCCFCSWHESVLLEEIRTGSRRWTRKTTQPHQSKCLARLLVFLTKKQADKHKACAKSIYFRLWMQ